MSDSIPTTPTTPTAAPRKSKGKGKTAAAPRKRSRPAPRRLTPNQRLALTAGAVSGFVLLLSVWECTNALATLTGMPLVLAGMLAVGIDCGMVVSEVIAVAATVGHDARRWAERYVLLAVALSVALNATAAAAHAEGYWKIAAAAVGAMIPVLVFLGGKVAGHAWNGQPK